MSGVSWDRRQKYFGVRPRAPGKRKTRVIPTPVIPERSECFSELGQFLELTTTGKRGGFKITPLVLAYDPQIVRVCYTPNRITTICVDVLPLPSSP